MAVLYLHSGVILSQYHTQTPADLWVQIYIQILELWSISTICPTTTIKIPAKHPVQLKVNVVSVLIQIDVFLPILPPTYL